ncbi:class I SAM-dependent methyltransferase [Candidatus Parcubacteria bacterium]|nr:class I SAM-dependent methyltransferase [Candidatus Parcubacteria bacterium]
MIKKYLEKLYSDSEKLNIQNISVLLEKNNQANFLDLGCDDGALSVKFAKQIGTKNIYGVDVVDKSIEMAKDKGVKIKKFDLNGKFDFEDNFFDAIHANQVIEHLNTSDNFLSEIYRILKPNGYVVISTENASSWCNIFSGIMGWQIFSLTNFSNKAQGIGNPLALHKDRIAHLESWNHVRIYNIRGLKEYFEILGFKIEEIKGAGYFPLPSFFGNIDKTHCHFMTFKIRK